MISTLFTGACWEAKRSWGNSEDSAKRLRDVQEGPGRDGETTRIFLFPPPESHNIPLWPSLPKLSGRSPCFHRRVSCSASRAAWSRKSLAGGLNWSCRRESWKRCEMFVFFAWLFLKRVSASNFFFISLKTQMSQKVASLEQEIERLSDGAELENVSTFSFILFVYFIFYLATFSTFCHAARDWRHISKYMSIYIIMNAGTKNMLKIKCAFH